tara:strand:+ start:153 stop:308 length:156 start_codon:yes stop_codon:yes gene_type:complete
LGQILENEFNPQKIPEIFTLLFPEGFEDFFVFFLWDCFEEVAEIETPIRVI